MIAKGDFYDALETRAPEQREKAQMALLAEQVVRARERSPYYARLFRNVDARRVTTRAALAKLSITRKHDLIALMQETPPMGGLNIFPPANAALIFTSPGPLYELVTDRADYHGAARALHAAGFRKGDIIHVAFSYHLTPGAWIIHNAARHIGCAIIPAGVGNTEQQVQVIAQMRPGGYAGTPDFLKLLLDTADRLGRDLSCLQRAIVGGGPLFPQLRQHYQQRGIQVFQTFATAELGNIAHESPAFDGMIVAEDKVVEVVEPETGIPVREGETGELVVTSLNPDNPLIRFATGDLTAVLPGRSPCGRTNMRIKGWLGRADQTTKVRGMFVHPEQINEVLKRHPAVKRARLVVDAQSGLDRPVLRYEAANGGESLAAAIAKTFQAVCKVRAEVEQVLSGTLPNDGKLIEDARKLG
jgi:phenylacetate-CoA ligase